MLLLKKINNNFAIALDSKGEQIIVEGRGIGFPKMPYDLDDLSRVTRTYYGFDAQYVDLLKQIPQEVMDVSNKICERFYAVASGAVNPNLPFTLADHINFAIKRLQNGIKVKMPLVEDLAQLYPQETSVAEYALKLIRRNLKVPLPKSELSGFVISLVNSEVDSATNRVLAQDEAYIQDIVAIINQDMGLEISTETINYTRFKTHMNYLFKRLRENRPTKTDNLSLYEEMKAEYPAVNACVEHIALYLGEKNFSLIDEEKLYLILHVNRVCSRD